MVTLAVFVLIMNVVPRGQLNRRIDIKNPSNNCLMFNYISDKSIRTSN